MERDYEAFHSLNPRQPRTEQAVGNRHSDEC